MCTLKRILVVGIFLFYGGAAHAGADVLWNLEKSRYFLTLDALMVGEGASWSYGLSLSPRMRLGMGHWLEPPVQIGRLRPWRGGWSAGVFGFGGLSVGTDDIHVQRDHLGFDAQARVGYAMAGSQIAVVPYVGMGPRWALIRSTTRVFEGNTTVWTHDLEGIGAAGLFLHLARGVVKTEFALGHSLQKPIVSLQVGGGVNF